MRVADPRKVAHGHVYAVCGTTAKRACASISTLARARTQRSADTWKIR